LLICTAKVEAAGDELQLPAKSAFAIGTSLNIESVREMETGAFNDSIRVARERGEPWTTNAILIALRFARLGEVGCRQVVSAEVSPSEWEPGRKLNWIRVTLEEGGWLDDSVSGQRYVVWLTPDTNGRLTLRRALWAQECGRPYWRYYSAAACP
jgi:hypothetical protein